MRKTEANFFVDNFCKFLFIKNVHVPERAWDFYNLFVYTGS
jgi:hypothetical protein